MSRPGVSGGELLGSILAVVGDGLKPNILLGEPVSANPGEYIGLSSSWYLLGDPPRPFGEELRHPCWHTLSRSGGFSDRTAVWQSLRHTPPTLHSGIETQDRRRAMASVQARPVGSSCTQACRYFTSEWSDSRCDNSFADDDPAPGSYTY